MAIKYTVLKNECEENNHFELKIPPKGNLNVFLAENKGACINLIGKYLYRYSENTDTPIIPPGGGGTEGNITIITTNDFTAPTDENVYSALRSNQEFLNKKTTNPQEIAGNTTFKRNVVIEEDTILHKGFKTPNFVDVASSITGAQLTAAGMLTVNGIKAMSFEIFELIYNVIKAQGGKYVFSPCANVEYCQYKLTSGIVVSSEDYYSNYIGQTIESIYITLKKEEYNKNTIPFKNGDILFGFVNRIGNSGQYAVGGQCLLYVIQDNNSIGLNGSMTIEVAMFPIGYKDPYGNKITSNIPPTNGMILAQRGNIDPDGNEDRLTSFFIDTETSNIIMLQNVYTPFINKDCYSVVIGNLPSDLLQSIKLYLPVRDKDSVVYAKYGIFQNILHYDHQGKPIPKERNRGTWSRSIAEDTTLDDKGNYINRYKSSDKNTIYDTVTYEGQFFKCLISDTTDRPGEGLGWLLIVAKGNDGTSIKVQGHYDTYSEFISIWQNQDGTWKEPDDISYCYVVEGYLYVWIPESREWSNIGQFKGEQGAPAYLHIAYANKDSEGNIIDFSVNDSSNKEWLGTYTDDKIDDSDNPKDYTKWVKIKGEKGDPGDSGPFKSIVFKRNLTEEEKSKKPVNSATTSYSNPIPAGGWSDGIPSGTGPIYSSFSTFFGNNINTEWSIPQEMVDSADFEVMYSSLESKPDIPKGFNGTNDWWELEGIKGIWTDDPQGEPIWMATNSRSSGSDWTDNWTVSKIKGEKGDPGVGIKGAFTSVIFKRSSTPITEAPKDTEGTYDDPVPKGWFDGIPQGTDAIYTTSRVFYGNGTSTSWAIPVVLADSDTFETMYSDSTQRSNIPDNFNNSEEWWKLANNAGWYDEPSSDSDPVWMATISRTPNSLWKDSKWVVAKIKGESGTSPYYADLDNEIDNVGLTFDGKAIQQYTLSTNVKLFYGTEEIALDDLSTTPISGWVITPNKTDRNITFTIPKGTQVAERTSITITLTAGSITRYLNFTVVGVKAGKQGESPVLYDIKLSDNQIIKKKDGSLYPKELSSSVYKTIGNSSTTAPTSEYKLKYYIDGSSTGTDYTKSLDTSTISNQIKFELLVNDIIMDTETVSVIEDGTDGLSIRDTIDYYGVSSSRNKEPEDWSTEIKIPDKDNPFLWHYQKVEYNIGDPYESPKVIISNFSKDGDAGKGIVNVETYYYATKTADGELPKVGVIGGENAWSTNSKDYELNGDNYVFLWSYTLITYTKGDPNTSNTEPSIIGSYGHDAAPTYWLYPDVPKIHVNKEGIADTSTINVSVYKSDSSGIKEMTTQDELDKEGLQVWYSIDGISDRKQLILNSEFEFELEDGSGVIGAEDGELYLSTEENALSINDINYYIILWLTKDGVDIDSNKIEKSWDGIDGSPDWVDTVEYNKSSDDVTAPETGWNLKKPHVPKGMYLWTRTTYHSKKVVYATSYQGMDGSNGKSIYINSNKSSVVVYTGEVITTQGSSIQVIETFSDSIFMECIYDSTIKTPEFITVSSSSFVTYTQNGGEITLYFNIPLGTLVSSLPSSVNVIMSVKDGDSIISTSYNITIIQSKQGLTGKQGETGPLYWFSGGWTSELAKAGTFNKDDRNLSVSVVEYNGQYYLHGGDNDLVKKGYTPDYFGSGWNLISPTGPINTELLLANFAKLGSKYGAIFFGNHMFSQYGKVKGIEGSVEYSKYKDVMFSKENTERQKLSGEFIPNYFVDFYTGATKQNKVSEPFNRALTNDNDNNIYKIDLEGGHNVVVHNVPYLISMPNPTDIIVNNKVEVYRDWDSDGVRSTIVVQPNFEYQNIKGTSYISWSEVSGYCTILCADGRVLDSRSYKNEKYEPQGFPESVIQTTEDSSHAGHGFFIINGQLSKFLVLEPGAIVNLRSCTTIMGDKEIIYWYVENQTDFERIKLTIFVLDYDTFEYNYDGVGHYYSKEVVFGSKYLRALMLSSSEDNSFAKAAPLKYNLDLEYNKLTPSTS